MDYEELIERTRKAADEWWNVDAVPTLGEFADAIEALLEERESLRAQLDNIRKYADQRAAYGRAGRTVGSARIASDLFAMLSAPPSAERERES